MPKQIVECIANFSEGRRPEVLEAIKTALTSQPGVSLLDQHTDYDHNRTVFTFVGAPEEIEESAFRAIQKAAELINLDEHTGEHPRIGATDVVPFVPIQGVSMEDCIKIAYRLGKRVGEQLNIPVYLYEEATKNPLRKNLEVIRKGQYETLKQEIATNPDRAPDYGPKELGTAGATVIGARHPLIAFNVFLKTDDVKIAKKIARAIRHSSGGLRYVKALGLEVDHQAQVSMNLTNFRGTPIARVVELIKKEAMHYGVNIDRSELVGLIPQESLIDAAKWYIHLEDLNPEQILENKIASAESATLQGEEISQVTDYGFLEALAAGTPTPGGGSAAAYSAAAGAALVEMVARLTIGKKKYAEVENRMQEILKKASEIRSFLTTAIERDARAFTDVLNAFMLPKETPTEKSERLKAINEATINAAKVPLEVAEKACEVIDLAYEVVSNGNINAISDGASGAALARAGLTSAGYNVRINLVSVDNDKESEQMLGKLLDLEKQADKIEENIRSTMKERGRFPLP
jgi:glutamate formiminotransferase / formiminotetrahydrofolate cyclodeaminase